MSSYPITGCGLASKPRYAEPSMFEILSWVADNDLAKSTFEQPQQQCIEKTPFNHPQSSVPKVNSQEAQAIQNPCKSLSTHQQIPQTQHEQIYKEHKSPHQLVQTKTKPEFIPEIVVDQNEPKIFQKSHLFKKQIKHELNSYEPVNLKASRAKSALNIPKTNQQDKFILKKEEVEFDQKTIKERKQKIKQFEVFTRILPNSAFTTYYGKPAFENYGRGTSYQNLKSFNVMPHKGDNHPKNIQSHYTALIKARNVKSKSYMPRKPLEEVIPPHQEENQELKVPQLPLEKPDLLKSLRFAKIAPETGKKAGPPQTSKRKIQSSNNKPSNMKKKKSKSFKQQLGDGLKYLNKRQNLIDILEEKKLKASQLAYKVTECYPLEVEALNLQNFVASKENREEVKPAGKASSKGDALRDLIQSRFVLQQNGSQA